MSKTSASSTRSRLLEVAERLGALQFGDFTLSSGQKSKFYFDDRLLTLHPEGLKLVAEAFWVSIEECGARAVGGPTIAADPIVGALTLVAGQRGLPVTGFLVRSQPKAHGLGKQVEGPLEAGTRVAIVDGTLSTGSSMFTAIRAAEDAGCTVVRVLAILDRHQGGSDRLLKEGYRFTSLLEATPEGAVLDRSAVSSA